MYASLSQKIAHQRLLEAIDQAPDRIPCAETDPELFFPDDEKENGMKDTSTARVRMARELCETCPVMAQCKNYAVMYFEMEGIWGGTTPKDRAKIRSRLGVTRPPSMANQPFPEFW